MVKIVEDLLLSSKYSQKSPYLMIPTRIVVHNTANDASAKNEIAYMKNNDSTTSFHYAVDDIEVRHGIPENRNAFHAGDGNGKGNRESIGIEICYSKSGGDKFNKSEDNAAEFIASLLKKYKWDISKVTKHQDYNGKYCPHRTLDLGWSRFLDRIKVYMISPDSLQYLISKTNLASMVSIGVVVSPDYWADINLQYLNDLCTNAIPTLNCNINNGVKDFNTALKILVDAKVISTPQYWINHSKEIKYLSQLIINMANKCKIVLEKIVHAEACGEDEKGQIFVANVIMNRVKDKGFPNTIYDVVFQTDQFEPTRNGAYEKAVPSEKVKTSVQKVLSGDDSSKGALFFRTIKGADGSWHEKSLTKLFDHGNHRFYK